MDKISGLPDDLLVRILSFVPTKVAVSTSILSERWRFLWMWLPKLDYTCIYNSLLVDFIDKNLPLHRAPVIETLRLDFRELGDQHDKFEDVQQWVKIAVSRYVRELEIDYFSCIRGNILPSSLFTCESLVILILKFVTLMDVPSMGCLPSLKTLKLDDVTVADEKSLQQLLSICPVLENLKLRSCDCEDDVTIIIPSLQKLSLYLSIDSSFGVSEVDTPSLKYLKLDDWTENPFSFKNNMPKLKEAHVSIVYFDLTSVLGSITSVKHLTVCSEDVYGDGFVFDQLEHLTLCIHRNESSNLLAQFLKDSPNLRVLDISVLDSHGDLKENEMVCWNQPSSVPECILSSLQVLNWSPYYGRPQDRDIVVYILKNARHLRTVTINADDIMEDSVTYLEMIKELALSSRASSTCELVFVGGH